MSKIMLVNALDPEEVRVAVLRDSRLEELYVETLPTGPDAARASLPKTGNIYKGAVVNFKRELEAAFVDIGCGRHGFLHVSDVSFEGAKTLEMDERMSRVKDLLRSGREILVQVKKEGIGEKGPSLTTFVGLPGRYLVLMPQLHRIGVSRRIRDQEARENLKRVLAEINPPADLGFVIRTEARDMSEAELKRDVDQLIARWTAINQRQTLQPAPSLLYEEADLTVRALRDHLTADTAEVWIDSPEAYDRVLEFVREHVPVLSGALRLYEHEEPLFHHFAIEEQSRALMEREVAMPGGNTLVIDQTEAMIAIDVNSARVRHRGSSAAMILQTNLDAAREVARQLRLRDIGGLIVIDFIDMESQEDRDRVEDELRKALAPDKARMTVLPISDLGLLEMTRQRRRQALEKRSSENCPTCAGRGFVRSLDSLALAFLRELRWRLPHEGAKAETARRVVVRFSPARALAMANRLRPEIVKLEVERSVRMVVESDRNLRHDEFAIDLVKETFKKPVTQAQAPVVPSPAAEPAKPKKRRRKKKTETESVTVDAGVVLAQAAVETETVEFPSPETAEAVVESEAASSENTGTADDAEKKKRRRGKRGGRRHKKKSPAASEKNEDNA